MLMTHHQILISVIQIWTANYWAFSTWVILQVDARVLCVANSEWPRRKLRRRFWLELLAILWLTSPFCQNLKTTDKIRAASRIKWSLIRQMFPRSKWKRSNGQHQQKEQRNLIGTPDSIHTVHSCIQGTPRKAKFSGWKLRTEMPKSTCFLSKWTHLLMSVNPNGTLDWIFTV